MLNTVILYTFKVLFRIYAVFHKSKHEFQHIISKGMYQACKRHFLSGILRRNLKFLNIIYLHMHHF
jgi:hypothetical protein